MHPRQIRRSHFIWNRKNKSSLSPTATTKKDLKNGVNYQTSAVLFSLFLSCTWMAASHFLLAQHCANLCNCQALIFPPKASQSGVQEAEILKLMSDIAEVVHRVYLGALLFPTAIKRILEMFLPCRAVQMCVCWVQMQLIMTLTVALLFVKYAVTPLELILSLA